CIVGISLSAAGGTSDAIDAAHKYLSPGFPATMHCGAGGPCGGRFAHRTGERKFSKCAGVQRIVLGGLLLFVLLKILMAGAGKIIGRSQRADANAARFEALLQFRPMLAEVLKIALM